MTIAWTHHHTAHCESGVMSALLQHAGLNFDEAMTFGLSSALTFAYLPIVKLGDMPLISYRMPPGAIIRRLSKMLGLNLYRRKFSDPQQGMAALDHALAQGQPVGLQTSVFWLPYFPQEMRFHFNAHNLIVYGKEGDDYLISDPIFESVQRCPAEDLQRARFAKGALAGKGLMYGLNAPVPNLTELDMPQLIRRALQKTARQMNAPLFFIGTRGIKTLARQIERLPHGKTSDAYRKRYLGHIVRMQEEIGTGGAGFRYLYAYFLEQAAAQCTLPELKTAADELTDIGDAWRSFASLAVQQCRRPQDAAYADIADALRTIAKREQALWQQIGHIARDLCQSP
ncbi:MAG: BtrH N-terminal domain-containing protein [Neisseria sp.]|nr:BtrH N-terminal domain-containing protein [Neisseria sp.]